MIAKVRRLGGVAGLLVLVVLLSAPVGLVQAALVWQTETVDAAGDVGWDTSLALDSQGYPHISYLDLTNEDLKYAVFDGATWHIETVDAEGNVGWDTSLALDDTGHPHISYVDATNEDLKYAVFNGSTWHIETVDAEGVVGWDASLELDSTGRPHISYIDATNGGLKYATLVNSTWQVETVDAESGVSRFTSLELDSTGHPHISYFDNANHDLNYAVFDGSTWHIETVDAGSGVGWYTSLALDSAGQPHISYFDSTNGGLKYAAFDGTNWQIQTVDAVGLVGLYTSLALDSSGHPHISYMDFTNSDLKYATLVDSTWQVETIDADAAVGLFSSLALDSENQPHISYNDITNDALNYARKLLNHPPNVEAGDPYGGVEGSPISLQGAASDPESDGLTTQWSYTIDAADPGTTCTIGDPGQLATTFTCTDDGTFTLTLTADDGINPPVTDSATVTIANAAPNNPAVTATLGITQVTISVEATDPGENDVLSYAFDCDANDTYEVEAGSTPSATCPLSPQQEGTFSFGVQVSDDDDGGTTETVTVTIATNLCASDYTGVLRYSDSCRDYETAITIPDPDAPVTVCASTHNGLLRAPLTGTCAGHEISYELPEEGPLNVCVNTYSQTMRTVDDLGQCASHELGRVIAATEVGETGPLR